MVGGCNSLAPVPISQELDLPNQKAIAAMTLLGCRAVGGRAFGYYDHYGALGSFTGIRAISIRPSSARRGGGTGERDRPFAHGADDYTYGNIGGEVGWSIGGRHCLAVLLAHLCALDYAANHCRLDDQTRRKSSAATMRRGAAPPGTSVLSGMPATPTVTAMARTR